MLNLDEEKLIFSQGYKLVGGLDEAGRGPLAGPVVAACVACSPEAEIINELELINDSKKLTEKIREKLFEVINNKFFVGVGICDETVIDRINILQATFLAMKKAIGALQIKPDYFLVDGKFILPNCSYAQKPVIKGDSKIFSIAAASIVAKVTRDRIMNKLHEQYPQYGFDQHKGYGTKQHIEQIKKYGPSPIHRKSFEPIRGLTNNVN
jgi:ribonuclease HII